MRLDNIDHARASNRSTRRRALRSIAGILVGTVAVGTAGARNHVTEIDGPTVIDEPGEYIITEDISYPNTENPAIRIEADRVTLNGGGHMIRMGAGEGLVGVEVVNVTNLTLSNLSIDAGHCIDVSNAKNCTFEQIRMDDSLDAIQCRETDNTIIRQTVSLSEYNGIIISGSNNTVRNNEASAHDRALRVTGSNNTVRDNDVSNGSIGYFGEGITISGDRNTVQNNTAFGDYRAILLRDANNNTVVKNEINNDGGGIFLQESDQNTVTQNDVHDNWITLQESNHNTVTRNIVDEINDNGENNQIHANRTN